ncbi:SMP-30/gluconolactonase/LRE family protein [Azohydromonas caseinilytica]|uniref:SMP-30/gluconolactonase/LRE family protein n=1 Tax=Azohydromonas caseinilytica TaxID=2728836 RepID=A0A848FHD1_9BURK|nr:SMP-30/gluconolactonase/LRE family protein [Azohydromonas caseinilytica]NML17699.1 SMP-30/gluconolactonase/LRE family protein [Azohydromonas caseinilytica]
MTQSDNRNDSPAVNALCEVRNRVGESPLWSVQEQALYWVDIESRRLHRFDWAAQQEQRWDVPERIGCIALHAQGGLIAAMETGLFRLRPQAGGEIGIELLHAVHFEQPGMRFNDGRCDRQGRFWVSSMVMDMSLAQPAGVLYRYDRRGLVPMVEGLITGNGLAFSPDGRTLYLSDSHPKVQRVWAFDLDAQGNLSHRREFIDMNRHPGRPDGAAVDEDGAYWICGNDAGQVHRFGPDGRLERSLHVPVSKPAMCSFGGPELRHLFITSIPPAQPAAGFEAALDGAVFVTQPGPRGLPDMPFQP